MIVLGIEGTAWCASAAVYDTGDVGNGTGGTTAPADADGLFIESDAYEPESGGIHPREAAEHMAEAIPRVVDAALTHAESEYGPDSIDAVAFSRGPGLGPCLRTVGTAARALAGTLEVPLVGVNHMVAHLEIGRHQSGFSSPVCLNASGANAHLLGFHDGRYRVLGETMDTGVGNAIDKFTRHVGWTHPGGPKVEAAAADADPDTLLDLPYVVKGMDFSFSGIMSAAKDAVDAGEPVEDVCFALQEHIFAMLTEVAERALSLTGADELVLGGGVGQNDRLREMLESMCRERRAEFYAPEPRFLRDNAGMIAVLGAKMAMAGDILEIAESAVDPDFRPDQVPVTWREGETVSRLGAETAGTVDSVEPAESVDSVETAESVDSVEAAESVDEEWQGNTPGVGDLTDLDLRGAEAVVALEGDDRVIKRRVPKAYRHPDLDAKLRRERTTLEARLTSEARRAGVPTPLVHDVDVANATLTLQYVGDADLSAGLSEPRVREVGAHLARLHGAGIVHGDPTTRNVRVDDDRTFFIDFGLGFHSGHVEDHAMDLHVFEQSLYGTATAPEALVTALEESYADVGDAAVLARLRTIEGRGRYQ